METLFQVRPVSEEGSDAPHGVAAGRLNLDDVGTHVGHQLAAKDTQGAG
jgi:hypothetical protein